MIPVTNFNATFSNIGYLGIKNITDKVKVNYSQFTVIEAYDLKDKLE